MKRKIETYFTLTPLLLPLVVYAFTITAYQKIGQLPYYAHPDPGNIFSSGVYGIGLWIFQIAFFASVYNLVLFIRALFFKRDLKRKEITSCVVAVAFYSWIYADPKNLLKWFLD